MYGQMTAGSWIYIGTQGILQGTYETFAAVAAKTVRRHPGRHAHADRRLRRHGRRATAGGHHERRRVPDRRRRPVPAAAARRAPLPRRGRRRPRGRDHQAVEARTSKRACRSAWSATRPQSSPNCCAAACRSTSSPTRPARTTRCRTCRSGSSWRTGTSYAAKKPEEFTDRARESMAEHVEAMVGFQDAGAEVFDYGNSIRGEAQLGRLRAGLRLPRLRARLHPPAVLRGQGPVPLGGALRRPGRHRTPPTRPCWSCSRRTSRCTGGSRLAGERVAFQGLPARICWLGYGERDKAGLRSTTWWPAARCRRPSSSAATTWTAARWPAPTGRPRRWRRLRRDRRLAAAQRAGQHAPAARPGCPSTTAAASASAGPSTPARSASPTAPTLAAQKIERVLTNDPGMGVIRHVDAGYERAERGRRGTRRPDPDAGGRVTTLVASGSRALWAVAAADRAGPGHRRLPAVRLDAPPTAPAASWFVDAGRPSADLTVRDGPQRQPWAWWGDPAAGDAVVTGSHLDSVPHGGAYDGPLGDRLRVPRHRRAARRGVSPRRPLAVVAASPRRRAPGSASPAWARRLLTGAHRGRPGAAAARRRRRHPGRRDARGRADPDALGRDRAGARPHRRVRRAARRAGPGAGRHGRPGRGRQRDLAARPLAVRLHRRGQPRRHHPDGRPPRPDAARFAYTVLAANEEARLRRRARHLGPGRGRAERAPTPSRQR